LSEARFGPGEINEGRLTRLSGLATISPKRDKYRVQEKAE
jgi:hypothetical protein